MPSYLEAATKGAPRQAPSSADLPGGAPADSQGPGETVAEASHGALSKTQARRKQRARTIARLKGEAEGRTASQTAKLAGAAAPGQRIPATQRVGSQAAPRATTHRRLGKQRRATTPDRDGWQLVLRRDEDRPPPRKRKERTPPPRGIPPEYDGRCLNCLSFNHKIATCNRPRLCARCRSPRHLAKDCKRPPVLAAAGGAPDSRFVRARRGGSSTPQGSAAERAVTPPDRPRPRILDDSCEDPFSEFADRVPPDHPAFRPWEADCYIQRDDAINSAEACMQLALVAQPSGDPGHHTTSEVLLALVAAAGVRAEDIRVKKFFPQRFIVLCASEAIKDRVLATSPAPFGVSTLILLPWSRVANADLTTLYYKLTIELEGVPPHVWREETVAKILAPYCWIQEVEAVTAVANDLSAYKLTAWTANPSNLPKIIWLSVAEPPADAIQGEGFRFRGTTPFLNKKDMLRYKVIVHLRSVRDFDPPTSSDDSSTSDDPAEEGRNRKRHRDARGAGVRLHPFACHRGTPDGTPPTSNAIADHGRQHSAGLKPRRRVPATERVGPNAVPRVAVHDRLGTRGPRQRVPAIYRVGPNAQPRVPAKERICFEQQTQRGPKQRKQKWQEVKKQPLRPAWQPKTQTRPDAGQQSSGTTTNSIAAASPAPNAAATYQKGESSTSIVATPMPEQDKQEQMTTVHLQMECKAHQHDDTSEVQPIASEHDDVLREGTGTREGAPGELVPRDTQVAALGAAPRCCTQAPSVACTAPPRRLGSAAQPIFHSWKPKTSRPNPLWAYQSWSLRRRPVATGATTNRPSANWRRRTESRAWCWIRNRAQTRTHLGAML